VQSKPRGVALIPFLFALALPLAACSDPTGTTPVVPQPAFAANPASQGATIVRYETGNFFIWWYDADTQLLVAYTFRNGFPGCGDIITDSNPVTVQEVISGHAELLIHGLMVTPEVFTWVWSIDHPSWIDARCGTPVASGVARFMSTNNDIAAAWPDSERQQAQAVSFKGVGELAGVDGQRYRFSAFFMHEWRPASGIPFKEVVRVQLVPIGN